MKGICILVSILKNIFTCVDIDFMKILQAVGMARIGVAVNFIDFKALSFKSEL